MAFTDAHLEVIAGNREHNDAHSSGVILGACFLAYLDREGLANVGSWINTHFHTHLDVPLYEFGIFGAILLVVMLFRPEGLIPSSRRAAEFHEGVSDEPLYDATA